MPKVRINASARVMYSREVEITDEEWATYNDPGKLSGYEYDDFFEGLFYRVVDHETDLDFDADDLTVRLVT